jgi:tetratricopeptide (TPR) repeat protein
LQHQSSTKKAIMKNYILTISLLLISVSVAFSQNEEYTNEEGESHLIGKCNRAAFEKESYKKWYDENYAAYTVNTDLLKKAKRKTKGITFQIFLGTWCGDSKREVPRFFKILDALKIEESALEIISLSNKKECYKQSPTQEEKGKLIFRVPTFIVYKNGVEIGRIVESPVTSLEIDLVQILLGLPTAPNYNVVHQLENSFAEKGIPNEKESYLEHARKVQRFAHSSVALNNYGYILLGRNEVDKAIAVFFVNAILHRNNANAFDSLAEAYEKKGDTENALKMYQKAVEINPNSDHAVEKIAELKR